MTPITPVRAILEWPAMASTDTAQPPLEEVDTVTLTPEAQTLLEEQDERAEGTEEADSTEALIGQEDEDTALEDEETEEIERPTEEMVEDLILSRLRDSDRQFREGQVTLSPDVPLMRGSDGNWYAVGPGVQLIGEEDELARAGGPTEFGPLDHVHEEGCRYCAQAVARYEAAALAPGERPEDPPL